MGGDRPFRKTDGDLVVLVVIQVVRTRQARDELDMHHSLINVTQIAKVGHRRCVRCVERPAGYEVSIGLYVRLICEPCLIDVLLDAFPVIAEENQAA